MKEGEADSELRCGLWLAGFVLAVGHAVELEALSTQQLQMATECGDAVAAQGGPAMSASPPAIALAEEPLLLQLLLPRLKYAPTSTQSSSRSCTALH